MTVAQAKARTNQLYTGSSDAVDTDTASALVMYFNIFKDTWFDEPDVRWKSTREMTPAGTIGLGKTLDIDEAAVDISLQQGDYLIVTHLDGNETEYTLVPIERLTSSGVAYPVALSGTILTFRDEFIASSPGLGGSLSIPRYIRPDDVVGDNDDIPVDDPNYVCFMAANELCSQDESKVNQAPRMLNFATQSMQKMKQNNGSQVETILRDASMFGWNHTI